MKFPEDRPDTWAIVLLAFLALALVDYLVRRWRGTWVPYRRRVHPFSRRARRFGLVGMVAVAALGVGIAVDGALRSSTGGVLNGLAMLAGCAWIIWIGIITGRDQRGDQE